MLANKVQELEQENIALKAQVETLQDICGNRVELPKKLRILQQFHSALHQNR